jgi:broad specificity phosphatase PhoE
MVQEIFVLRHAAPDRTTTTPYNVVPGPPLTPIGRREALQAGIWLGKRQVDAAYVSPFARTRQTAAIVSEHLFAPFAYVDDIQEGAPGEQHASVRTRVRAFLDLLDRKPLQRVLVVTHGCCVLATLEVTTDDRIDLRGHTYDYGNKSPTAGIWHGQRQGDGLFAWELAFTPSAD